MGARGKLAENQFYLNFSICLNEIDNGLRYELETFVFLLNL